MWRGHSHHEARRLLCCRFRDTWLELDYVWDPGAIEIRLRRAATRTSWRIKTGTTKVHDSDRVVFLQWCLPKLGLRWKGFRKVRRTVCKRIDRRMRSLEISGIETYRQYLGNHPEEWARLDAMCRIPISRFYRDRRVYQWLADEGFPLLTEEAGRRGEETVRCWSAGCASGEEPYSLKLAWSEKAAGLYPRISLKILATDVDDIMIKRARKGCYTGGSLRELSAEIRSLAFERTRDLFCIRERWREGMEFELQDMRKMWPEEAFDLIACRNTAFTYFEPALQVLCLRRIADSLSPGGLLVIGGHESLPECGLTFEQAAPHLPIFRKRG